MILGHYASALIPYSRFKKYPFWILLLSANVPEFLWLILAFSGVEKTIPASLSDATFQNLKVNMIYSHNLVPAFLQGTAVGVLILSVFRDRSFAFWCGFLAFFHVLCDLVVGFEHQVLGADSPVVSLNSYFLFPHAAILIECAFSFACVFWYIHTEKKQGMALTKRKIVYLFLFFGIGVLMWMPNATVPLKDILPFF
ncbi:MAG TPA: hypothetical protein PL048_00860 [Leptospiraceae bacterium]|nr:hypothetical protein [Leptospiraceae bacterium]HMY65341.1 hypothetical protein [Leptospiraceae bacterium]HMZ57293.1 hypothetical protein [Leptospiraceae bacterium]HNF12124.1 hypothetical protein [Leptospiraceae bacterium]HNF23017.1 hypothetical protein [Leptospiraceae bacterium]